MQFLKDGVQTVDNLTNNKPIQSRKLMTNKKKSDMPRFLSDALHTQ